MKKKPHEASEIEPIDRLNDLCKRLKAYSFEIHRGNDEDEEYSYLCDDDVCITVLNSYQDKKLFIDLSDEFTLSFDAFHRHYYSYEYSEMIKCLRSILNNKHCSVSLYCNKENKWMGSSIISKSERSKPIRKFFPYIYGNDKFHKLLTEYGGEVHFCFWNPKDDRIIKIPPDTKQSNA